MDNTASQLVSCGLPVERSRYEAMLTPPMTYNVEDQSQAAWITTRFVILAGNSKVPLPKDQAAEIAKEDFGATFEYERNDAGTTDLLVETLILKNVAPRLTEFTYPNSKFPVDKLAAGKYGLGIKCGEPSTLLGPDYRIYVFDADSEESAKFLEENLFSGDKHTFMVKTARGMHFYVASKHKLPTQKIAEIDGVKVQVDFRGYGSYVVAPGMNINGHEYISCHRHHLHVLYELTDEDIKRLKLKTNSGRAYDHDDDDDDENPDSNTGNKETTIDLDWVAPPSQSHFVNMYLDASLQYIVQKLETHTTSIGDQNGIMLSTAARLPKKIVTLLNPDYDFKKQYPSRSEAAHAIINTALLAGSITIEEIVYLVTANPRIASHYLDGKLKEKMKSKKAEMPKLNHRQTKKLVQNILADVYRCIVKQSDYICERAKNREWPYMLHTMTPFIVMNIQRILRDRKGDRYANQRTGLPLVFNALVNIYCGAKTPDSYPINISRIRRMAGVHSTTVRKALDTLKELGLITIFHEEKVNKHGEVTEYTSFKFNMTELCKLLPECGVNGLSEAIKGYREERFKYLRLFQTNTAIRTSCINPSALHHHRVLTNDTLRGIDSFMPTKEYALTAGVTLKTARRRRKKLTALVSSVLPKKEQYGLSDAVAYITRQHFDLCIEASKRCFESLTKSILYYEGLRYHGQITEEEYEQKLKAYQRQLVPKERFAYLSV